ncbi:hypothetical protein EMPS_08066 [Entomortierella parvispora]|uniref:Uncharacterized protein n=1 Tax=Entomortierella parvispora TaxID=205924 RepID=A0A9P3HG07_9FUNG|nr:hypothetical protein EMPS_08066 [Entomortierella parvispora]
MLYTPVTQARMYGGTIACYLWGIYLCDFYRLDLWMSVVYIILGLYFLWQFYPSSAQHRSHANEIHCSQQGQAACQEQQQQQQQQQRPAFFSRKPVSSISTAVLSTSGSSPTPSSTPTMLSVLAQEFNASGEILPDLDDIVLNLSVYSEGTSANKNSFQSYPADSPSDNTIKRNDSPRRSQYAWLFFITHSLVILGCLAVTVTTRLADWTAVALAFRGLMILGVLSCYGLFAHWTVGALGVFNLEVLPLQQPQQELVEDGRPVMIEAALDGIEVDPHAKMEKRHPFLSISGPSQQFLHQQRQTKDIKEIVKHQYSFCRPAAKQGLSPLSTMDHIRQEMRLWALSFYFLLPEAVPRPLFKLYEHVDDGPESFKASEYGRDDVEPLMNDANNDRYDIIPTTSTVSHHGSYERREQDTKMNSEQATRKKPMARLPTLGPWNRFVAPDSTSSPAGSTLVKLAKLTMDSERLTNIFNYYRRQNASYSYSISGLGSQGAGKGQSDQIPNLAFVVRSNTLPTVRVGIYGASERRLWTASGSTLVTATPVTLEPTTSIPETEENEDIVMVDHPVDDQGGGSVHSERSN